MLQPKKDIIPPNKQSNPTKVLALPGKKKNFDTGDEDPLQYLWAISYSDLLMVLMCFFIIFFEMSEVINKNPIKEIITIVKEQLSLQPAFKKIISSSPSFEGHLADKTVEAYTIHENKNEIIIDLPNTIYNPGEYFLPIAFKHDIKNILNLIKQFSTKINVTFIGHTDEQPIHFLYSKNIDSNLMLSTYRASSAAEYAYTLSIISPESIFVQGEGQYKRKTRSLSIKITPKIFTKKTSSKILSKLFNEFQQISLLDNQSLNKERSL